MSGRYYDQFVASVYAAHPDNPEIRKRIIEDARALGGSLPAAEYQQRATQRYILHKGAGLTGIGMKGRR